MSFPLSVPEVDKPLLSVLLREELHPRPTGKHTSHRRPEAVKVWKHGVPDARGPTESIVEPSQRTAPDMPDSSIARMRSISSDPCGTYMIMRRSIRRFVALSSNVSFPTTGRISP